MPPTHSLIALKQYMKGAGCLCGGALSVNAFRRCHLSRSERQGLFRCVLGSPFGRAVERSETERARSLPAGCPLRQCLSALPPPPKWEARALLPRSWLSLWESCRATARLRGLVFRQRPCPLRRGLRRATSPGVRGKGSSPTFLALPLGELSSDSETERARSLPAGYPLRHGLRRATSPGVRGKGSSATFLALPLGELSSGARLRGCKKHPIPSLVRGVWERFR